MLKRGITQLINAIEGRVFDRSGQSSSEGVRGRTVEAAKLLPPLSDEIVLTRIWPLLHRNVNISLLWRLRRVNRTWKESVATTLEWAALEIVRVDTLGYIRYLQDRGERCALLRERVEDELKVILVLLSERLADYTSRSEWVRSKTSSCEKDDGDWSSTDGSVDLVCACRWTKYPCSGIVRNCGDSVCNQNEGRGFDEDCAPSLESSMRTYFPRHLMRVR